MGLDSYLATFRVKVLKNLQHMIDDLKAEDFDTLYTNITLCPFFNGAVDEDDDKQNCFIYTLLESSCEARFNNIELYADFVKYFFDRLENQVLKNKMHEILVKYIRDSVGDNNNYWCAFVVQLLNRNVITKENLEGVRSVYFCLENPDHINNAPYKFNLLELPEDDPWPEFIIRRNRARNASDIATAIRTDDVKQLEEIISQTNEVNELVDSLSSLDRFDLLTEDPVMLIQYAAAYGSLKCFNFLLEKNAEINPKEDDYYMLGDHETIDYAVASGNMDIIQICEQNGFELGQTKLLTLAIRFHQMKVFWMLLPKCNNDVQHSMTEAIRYNNFIAIYEMFKKGFFKSIDFASIGRYIGVNELNTPRYQEIMFFITQILEDDNKGEVHDDFGILGSDDDDDIDSEESDDVNRND